MSMTKDALQHIEQSHKTGTEVANGHALVVGDDFNLQDLEKYQPGRRRFRGRFETEGLADFARYVQQNNEAAPVFVDRERMSARSFLDIGDIENPGHCDHAAALTLPKTPEYRAFLDAAGSTFDQEGIVELIEDWGHLMRFTNSQGEDLELRRVLHAFRKVSIDDLTSIDSDRQEHSAQVGVMNKVTVKNAERLPACITWRLTPYEGLREAALDMRVSSLTRKEPGFRLRAVALDARQQDFAREFASEITAALPEAECLLGTFTP